MNNFPYYQQFSAEMILGSKIVDEVLVEMIANQLIHNLGLNVVALTKHEFPKQGLTKVWILSQSHLVIHTWPEFNAIHFDLITCQPTNREIFERTLKECKPDSLTIFP